MSDAGSAARAAGCELCGRAVAGAQGPTTLDVAALPDLRVVRVLDAPGYPAFYRVIWQAHVAEWTDLAPAERVRCMDMVATVEQALRELLAPRKINLASLGNVVPHLHWHVIARFEWDMHFPQPIWSSAQRVADEAALDSVRARLQAVDARIARAVYVAGGD